MHPKKTSQKVFFRKGFSLPEVLVGISIMTLVIISSMQLVTALIRSNTENIDTLIAYGLAQEGLEGIRNIRDSNWLLGANFQGQLGKAKTPIWNAVFPALSEEAKYYVIDLKTFDTSLSGSNVTGVADVASVAPWELREIASPQQNGDYAETGETLLYKKEDDSLYPGEIHYTHQVTEAPTTFHRYIRIKAIPYSVQNSGNAVQDIASAVTALPSKYRVTSVVTWTEKGRDKEVRLESELTNWKEGY